MRREACHPVRTKKHTRVHSSVSALSEVQAKKSILGTYMVDTTMVGIIRSGTTSKTRRTNNQAVGLQKKRRMRPRQQSQWVRGKRTCNTRSSVRARKAGASQAHYTARSKTKTRSGRPVPTTAERVKVESGYDKG